MEILIQMLELYMVTRIKSPAAKTKFKPYFLGMFNAIHVLYAGDPDFDSPSAAKKATATNPIPAL